MAKFTLLELHLEDVDLTANAPFSGSSDEADGAGDGERPEEEASDGLPLAALVLLGLAVAVALAVRKLGGRDGESGDEGESA